MLEIGLVAGAAVGFFKLAKDNGLIAWVWALLAVIGYFAGAFIAGLFVGLLAPHLLNDQLTITLLGLAAGALGILIVYLILRAQIKRKNNESAESELLDNANSMDDIV